MTADVLLSHSLDKVEVNNGNNNTKLFTISSVCQNLLLCGAGCLRSALINNPQVSCVVSVTPELPVLPLNFVNHVNVQVTDTHTSDISQYLHAISDLIYKVKEEGGTTLVHCVAGVSRSPALVLAYLIKYENLSLKDAYVYLRSIRRCIRPNTGFFNQLIKFEIELKGEQSVYMVNNEAAGGLIPDVYEIDYEKTMTYKTRQRGTK